MSKIESHRDLKVWQAGMEMVERIYGLARQLPDCERYGLVSQMTRSAVSVPANIAEGHARGSRRDYAQFVSIARGSLMETETYVLLSIRLGFVKRELVTGLLDLISQKSKMLTSLRSRLLNA
jgi:four helix bundle protein